jgi:mannose-1-phosphate guanylyltransferase/mannose-6-phosphate isomerase
VVCSDDHRFLVTEQLADCGIEPRAILLEPISRNTAPAIAAAAFAALEHEPDAVLVVLPSDHLIVDSAAFREAVLSAVPLAESGNLVALGVLPRSPETGFGYIQRGEALAHHGYRVARFVEKPDADSASRFVASGDFLWNSGMFVFRARRFLDELGVFRPETLATVRGAWNARKVQSPVIGLDIDSLRKCADESVDYAVMEHTRHAAVVPADMGWSDLGSWAALWDASRHDGDGNVVIGDVDLRDSSNSYVRAETRLVSVLGVSELVVVETPDAVIVADKGRTQEIKEVVSGLERARRTEHLAHRRAYRPWGYYESVDSGEGYQVKRLMVKPGESLSLQSHSRRAEHWVVVSGRARVTRGEAILELGRNQSTYIPVGARHRLENPFEESLLVVEVQSGDYLGEDDIVRYEDRYLRS